MKWIHLTAQAKTEEDFALLTRMLDALGLRSDVVETYSLYTLQTFLPEQVMLEVIHSKNPRNNPAVTLTVSDPDSTVRAIKALGLEIVDDSSGPEPTNTVRHFRVRLPGGTEVDFAGFRASPGQEYGKRVEGGFNAEDKKFALVVSRFNSFITERLLSGAMDGLSRCGVTEPGDIVRVPGAFEIPSAARTLAETGKYDAIICIGCLLRGDTLHYDVIANEVTRGIGQSAQETGVPHAFGVLTCDTLEQAIDRAGLKSGNKGFEAALAAVEMANLKKAVSTGHSALNNKKQIPRSARNDKLQNSRNKKSRTRAASKSRPTSKARSR
jgi:6,7-dimethyl-8-ribityllumazine synthase